jgi:hypothetical protein
MTSSALASNVGGMAKRFASNQTVSKYLPRLQCGRKNSSTPIGDVMSQPYVAAIVLTESSGIDCEKQREGIIASLVAPFDLCGSRASSSSLTRWHRFEAVVVFCAAPLLMKRQASRGRSDRSRRKGHGCQPLLVTPIPSMSPGVAAHQIVTRSLSYLLL